MPISRITVVSLALVSALIGGSVLWAAQAQSPRAPGKGLVVVELFTSQGCSSCPPADALMARMAREPGVLVLTRPVTYWDRLGWRDTLARESNTDLQRRYAARGAPGAGVFTPQAMIEGRDAAVGSDEPVIRRLVGRVPIQPATIVSSGDPAHGYVVTVSGTAAATADIKAVAMRAAVRVRIGSGENGGNAINYANVVSDERVIGQWRGGSARFTIPPAFAQARQAERLAIIVQAGNGGPIFGAAVLR